MDIVYDIETTDLSPTEGKILAIGVKTQDSEIIFMEEDESKLLKRFWSYLGIFHSLRLIGFNTMGFDNNFVIIRSLKHRIPILDIRNKSLDLRFALNGSKYAKGRLEDYSQELLGMGKNGDGSKVSTLSKEELKKYLEQDIRLTWDLFQLMKQCKVVS